MDISKIKAENATLDVEHPGTGEPIGLKFTFLPMSDKKVKAVTRGIQDKLLKKRKKVFSPAEIEQNRINIICATICEIEWAKDASWNGEKLECNAKNVRKIIAPDTSDWIRAQCEEYIDDGANFFTK